ncbi:hypothetical protein BB559_003230 [Furculomyces boomerangus]|uniref:Calcineurin-like phosphoesterase domain-containing protein n=1 Tax=Furculomyces boomerangus TaxID=61424 RepID=A0A2T9YMM4_9FUNG|nr:hypothetical protein BB559_003230 [Furculomyces boomerangus]
MSQSRLAEAEYSKLASNPILIESYFIKEKKNSNNNLNKVNGVIYSVISHLMKIPTKKYSPVKRQMLVALFLLFRKGIDKLILLGDLVAKGPDSIGVIRRAMELEAIGVRGNHDDLVLRWYNYFKLNPNVNINDMDPADFPYKDFRVGGEHKDIARKLSVEEYNYLVSFPSMLKFQLDAPDNNVIIAVHGGLDPSKNLYEQSPSLVMRMRNILETGEPVEKKKFGGKAWFKVFNNEKENMILNKNTPSSVQNIKAVLYGHDASRNLQLKKFTKGLDTGCVYGRQLSAFVYPQEQLVQVEGEQYQEVKI